MRRMYNIGVMGDKDSVMGFAALGLNVYTPESTEEARSLLQKIAAGRCAILFITEQLAAELEDVIAKYDDTQTPAIIPIPNHAGTLGIGMANVSKRVERAVGSDIL